MPGSGEWMDDDGIDVVTCGNPRSETRVRRSDRSLIVDLGGTKVAVATAVGHDFDGIRYLYGLNAVTSGDRLVDAIVQCVGGFSAHARNFDHVAVGCTGTIDRIHGVLHSSANIAVHDYALADALRVATSSSSAILENDVNCAAIGEWAWGAGRGRGSLAYLTLSTGVGLGIVSGGRLVRGRNGRAGEIGHMVIVPGGELCTCGKRGCLEAYCSGNALRSAAAPAQTAGVVGGAVRRPARAVLASAYGGCAADKQLVDDALRYLGLGLEAVFSMLDPDVLVLGGGLIKNASFAAEVKKMAAEHNCGESTVVVSRLTPNPVLAGALYLALAGSDRL